MGYRLSKIYTRKGDKGMTRLGEGTEVPKDSPRVKAYGDIDELNSLLGFLLSYELPDKIEEALKGIQHDLFDMGGALSIPGHAIVKAVRVEHLESVLDELNRELDPLEEFILPGGKQAAALCHLARTVCRRAERDLVTLSRSEEIADHSLSYLNRLSDLLFVMARSINKSAGLTDVLWNRSR